MRGLPPVPAGVLRLDLEFDVNGYPLTTGLWFLVPDLALADLAWYQAFTAMAFFYLLPGTTGVTHDGVSLSTCRLASGGMAPFRYVALAPPNHGAYSGGQADIIASGVFVRTTTTARGSGSRLRFPGCPDDFVRDGLALSATAVSQLLAMANAITTFVASQTGPTGGQVLLGTLQRSKAGAPLAHSLFDPAVAVVPSYRVEYLDRRFPRVRHVRSL